MISWGAFHNKSRFTKQGNIHILILKNTIKYKTAQKLEYIHDSTEHRAAKIKKGHY